MSDKAISGLFYKIAMARRHNHPDNAEKEVWKLFEISPLKALLSTENYIRNSAQSLGLQRSLNFRDTLLETLFKTRPITALVISTIAAQGTEATLSRTASEAICQSMLQRLASADAVQACLAYSAAAPFHPAPRSLGFKHMMSGNNLDDPRLVDSLQAGKTLMVSTVSALAKKENSAGQRASVLEWNRTFATTAAQFVSSAADLGLAALAVAEFSGKASGAFYSQVEDTIRRLAAPSGQARLLVATVGGRPMLMSSEPAKP